MKAVKIYLTQKNLFIAASGVLLLFLFSSCATKTAFQNSTVVPAAEGSVKVKKDHNDNYLIKLDISNLAEPQDLSPSKATYVVWMKTSENRTENLGRINSSTGFLSNKLKASFETVSPVKPSKIFITAENDANTRYPGGELILTTGAI